MTELSRRLCCGSPSCPSRCTTHPATTQRKTHFRVPLSSTMATFARPRQRRAKDVRHLPRSHTAPRERVPWCSCRHVANAGVRTCAAQWRTVNAARKRVVTGSVSPASCPPQAAQSRCGRLHTPTARCRQPTMPHQKRVWPSHWVASRWRTVHSGRGDAAHTSATGVEAVSRVPTRRSRCCRGTCTRAGHQRYCCGSADSRRGIRRWHGR